MPWPDGVWRTALAEAFTDPAELLQALGLDLSSLGDRRAAGEAARRFAVRVPRGYVARMRHGDPADPLLKQVLPVDREVDAVPGYSPDPLGEHRAADGGVLRKYRGRALLVTTAACAVHCRYCFRRHFPYGEASLPSAGWENAVAAIADDPTVEEVILSGGDPLSLPDRPLARILDAVGAIDHVRRLRIHTRLPVVLPERVDHALLDVLGSVRQPLVLVLHANHAREIDDDVRSAVAALGRRGAVLLNQAVLLAGVNDTVEALHDLGTALVAAGVTPYYLHLLDRVDGAAHFDVPEETGRRLVGELAARASGYLVPRLVREQEGAPAKVLIPPHLP
jgi:EF-P beta-lysylation protein EpmB